MAEFPLEMSFCSKKDWQLPAKLHELHQRSEMRSSPKEGTSFSFDAYESHNSSYNIEGNSTLGSSEGVRGLPKASLSSKLPKMCDSSFAVE